MVIFMKRKIFKTFFIFLLSWSFCFANDKEVEDFMKNKISTVMTAMSGMTKKSQAYAYFKKNLPQHFAIKYLTKKSLGKAYDDLSEAEKRAFSDTFYDYLVFYYGTLLFMYKDQKIDVIGVQFMGNDKYLVYSKVRSNKVTINWLLRKSVKDNTYYIIDMIVSGVSLLNTQKLEYREKLKKHNGDISKLIQDIKKVIKESSH